MAADGATTYTVVLDSAPSSPVAIPPTSGSKGKAAVGDALALMDTTGMSRRQ